MLVAVEGCCHGMLDTIYRQLRSLPLNKKPDLLIICGDFQAVRNKADLNCLAVPPKYLQMGDFKDYYYGRKKAPILTVFVGGNHEASNHLLELKYGGWVCPNIYYMGKANVLNYKGIKIAGLSGIFNGLHFMSEAYEKVPFDNSTLRSVYHVRKEEYLKLLLWNRITRNNVDVCVSHDWPSDAAKTGNVAKLLKQKPYFARDVRSGRLGSPVNTALLHVLRPSHWFSAHLHVRYTAEYVHGASDKNEIELDMDSSEDEELQKSALTRFLALDKCLPKRKFLELVDVKGGSGPGLLYDRDFIRVNKAFEEIKKMEEYNAISMNDLLNYNSLELQVLLGKMSEKLEQVPPVNEDVVVPENFKISVGEKSPLEFEYSDQTKTYCQTFGIQLGD